MKKQLCSWKNVRRKKSSIWHVNKDFFLKNPKSLVNLKKCIRKKNGVIKTKNGNEFKRFRNVLELV